MKLSIVVLCSHSTLSSQYLNHSLNVKVKSEFSSSPYRTLSNPGPRDLLVPTVLSQPISHPDIQIRHQRLHLRAHPEACKHTDNHSRQVRWCLLGTLANTANTWMQNSNSSTCSLCRWRLYTQVHLILVHEGIVQLELQPALQIIEQGAIKVVELVILSDFFF